MKKGRLFTLMLIPHHGKRPLTFRLHNVVLYCLIIIIGAGVVGSALYFMGAHERAILKRELAAIERVKAEQERQLQEINQSLDELQSLGRRVKTLTGMGHDTSFLVEDTGGQGGPTLFWPTEEFYLTHQTMIPKVKERDIDELKEEIYLEKQTYRELIEELEEKEQFFACTPSICPVNGAYISSPYGPRRRPRREFHEGLDLVARRGTPVMATAAGKVIFVGWQGGFGNKVIVNHGNDYKTVYAHLDRIKVRWGEIVKKGQVVGTLGNTGYSTGPHLHYEVQHKGKKVDPLKYILVKLK